MTAQSHSLHASSYKRFLFACGHFCHVPISNNALVTEWTGLSIYADKNNPNVSGSDYLKVDVIVTVEGVLPTAAQGGGTVYVECLDPPNASGTGAANNGGTGIFGGMSTHSMTFYGDFDANADGDNNKMTQRVTTTLGIFAGDNYQIIAVSPSNYVFSEILTVWRRLWIELDQMEAPIEGTGANQFNPATKYYPGGSFAGVQWMEGAADSKPSFESMIIDFDVMFQPPKPDISLLTSAMLAAQLVMFGLLTGKRLEVLGDGARWIATWASGLVGVDVVAILCWWHLCKRVYEGLSGLGLSKEERKKWEREILDHLWRGEHGLAIGKLWGLRSSARNAKRINDFIGYLLRKKHQLTNDEERHARGEWIASTRVEKWNDTAVSQRCKHRGMSWTEPGVLAVATYAENSKQKSNHTTTCHTIS